MEVNADHGAIVNVYDGPPQIKKREVVPQPTRPLRGFVNRSNELKQLEQIIKDSDVATILGLDGMGKTALLKQVANSSTAQSLSDGVLFMEGIDEKGQALGFEDVIQRLFDKSFESNPPLKVNFDTAQTYLGNLKSLVILNGLDLPVASLSRMPDLYPRGAVMIESNQWIDDDISEEIRLGPLPRNEALLLLATKAKVKLDTDTRTILDAICTLLADVPLAIVIAARSICENKLSLEQARDTLASIKPRAAEAYQAGIERAFALARSTLTELERQWLAAAAFAPGISIDPQYLRRLAEDETTAEHTQERLQAMGLLTANSPRLRIHPGMRDLARFGVDEGSLREKFISYLKDMLDSYALDWNYCTDELGNILGMIDWSARQQRWSDVITLGRGIDPYLTLHGLWETWQTTIKSVLQSARRLGDRANEAWALHQLGTHALSVGLTGQAIDFLKQALDLRRSLGDVIGMAYTQHNLNLLIPPPSSGQDNGNPPDGSNGGNSFLGRSLKFLWKTMIIGAAILGGGYLAVNALNSTAEPSRAPEIPITAPTLRPSPTLTLKPTKTLTLTPTKVPTQTPEPTITSSLTPTFETPTPHACEPKLTGLQNANCRVGPSTLFDVYGTLFEGQTVDILAKNEEGTWLMVEHPQEFRNPCWVWIGPAVQEQGDLSCTQVKVVPLPSEQQKQANTSDGQPSSDGGNSSSEPVFDLPPLVALTLFPVCLPQTCSSGSYWDANACSCKSCSQPQACQAGYYWNTYACACQKIPQ
jgi:tetratricopeptide (TPR) repeat protein